MTADASSARCFVPYPFVPVASSGSGPLAGLRLAVKDIFDVAGYPTGCGNPHMLALSGVKTQSAAAVQALAQAGARFAGKVCTDELAFSMNGKNAHFGTPRNGGAPDRIPGGSSSGSASAVSNGLADIALGTDTGGSVRAPASHCGLIGLRPTHARVSLAGVMDLAPGFDTCGWFARDMDAFSRVGDVLLGADSAPLPETPRVLVAADVLALLEPRVQGVFSETLDRLAGAIGTPLPVKTASPSFDALYWAFRHIQGYEAWQTHGENIRRHDFQLGPGVAERFAWSATITPQQMQQHSAVRAAFREDFARLLGRDGVLLMPTVPDIAPLLTDSEQSLENYRNQAIRMLCLAGLSGFPQISLPLMRLDEAPFGFSVIAPAGSDRSLIRFAARLMHECA
ncbi:amidase [Herbaspirillum robiniae]|uniref:Amidase n=1 Tax=Herbaspirillum robiniae TaxID=2014887 RepID=A0A246WPM3_9BURK|nr:amidase [Herbaspirillum robiniae]NUU04664.1 amidase [Herbaspirillum robiniae]OWY28329.1 amidase [Herbaspirillum robiniae]